jgi:hypothetical protein
LYLRLIRVGDLPMLPAALRDNVWARIIADAKDLLLQEEGSDAPPHFLSLTEDVIKSLLQAVRTLFENPRSRASLQQVNPIQWWKSQHHFSALYPLVKLLLCIPASNAAAERAFSSAGFLSSGREQLSIENLERYAMIRHYLLKDEDESSREQLLHKLLQKISGEGFLDT